MFPIDGAKSITQVPLQYTMRTALSLILLLLLAPSIGAISASAEITDNGNSITVTGTETWDAASQIDKDLTVTDGATLFIDTAATVGSGLSITVAEGATLTLNGDLVGSDVDAGLLVYNDTELYLNFGDLSETGKVRINFDHTIPETAMFNVTIGNETQNAVGADFVDVPAALDGTPLVVEFHVYYFFATQITSVQALHSGSGGTVVIDAENLNHTGGSLKWNAASFILDVQGTLNVNGATIAGADINCAHTCVMMDATLMGSAPVHIGNDGSLTINQSSVQGSRTDEDIIAHDQATITYIDSTGTGGQTDAWIRLLSQRVLHTNAGSITLHATGLGYSGSTIDNVTDSNGHVDFARSEQSRIVEWLDGDGVYHEEDAEVLLTLSSHWGDFQTTIDAPRTPVATATVPLPFISVESIELEANIGSIGSKVSGAVVVKNSGTVAVTGVNFWCYAGTELQDTTQLTVSLEPGQTKTIYVSWYGNAAGSQALECKPNIPTVMQSITEDVSNINGATSDEVKWSVAEEVEDQPLMIYAALVAVVLLGTFIISNQASKKVNDSVRENSDTADASEEEKHAPEEEVDESDESEEAEDDSEDDGFKWQD